MATTATEWLLENPDDVEALGEMLMGVEDLPIRLWTELPEWMKQQIAERLKEAYEQPYWDNIYETTRGDAERVLNTGLQEGWSIRRMAEEMQESLGGDYYAMVRAKNIARTESGNALNGARKFSMDRLQEDLPELPMRPEWLSVLGTTTRADHANLDGVPADKDGTWSLEGKKIPWPGHFSLSPSQRCNCQCTTIMGFGVTDTEAQQIIQDYYSRDESIRGKSYRQKHLPGQHDQSTHGRHGPDSSRYTEEHLSKVLSKGDFDSRVTMAESSGEMSILTFREGAGDIKAVFKAGVDEPTIRHSISPGTAYKREAAFYDVAKVVGNDDLVPVSIVRKVGKKTGSVQEWIDDATVGGQVEPRNKMFGKDKKAIARAAAMDFVMGNTDRHEGNWVVDSEGKVKLIDNGLSLPHSRLYDTASGGLSQETTRITHLGFFNQAAMDDMSLTAVRKQWQGKWPEVEKTLRKQGIGDDVLKLAKERYDLLMDKSTKTFYDLRVEFEKHEHQKMMDGEAQEDWPWEED